MCKATHLTRPCPQELAFDGQEPPLSCSFIFKRGARPSLTAALDASPRPIFKQPPPPVVGLSAPAAGGGVVAGEDAAPPLRQWGVDGPSGSADDKGPAPSPAGAARPAATAPLLAAAADSPTAAQPRGPALESSPDIGQEHFAAAAAAAAAAVS